MCPKESCLEQQRLNKNETVIYVKDVYDDNLRVVSKKTDMIDFICELCIIIGFTWFICLGVIRFAFQTKIELCHPKIEDALFITQVFVLQFTCIILFIVASIKRTRDGNESVMLHIVQHCAGIVFNAISLWGCTRLLIDGYTYEYIWITFAIVHVCIIFNIVKSLLTIFKKMIRDN